MDVINFNERDETILYCFPKVPSELSYIISCYTFINRDAPPRFDDIISVFSKALRAGIIFESCGKYTVDEEWYKRIHINDGIAENEIESELLFMESFEDIELPVVNDNVRLFSREEYGIALRNRPF